MKQFKAAIGAVILTCLAILGFASLPFFLGILIFTCIFTGFYSIIRIIQEDKEI